MSHAPPDPAWQATLTELFEPFAASALEDAEAELRSIRLAAGEVGYRAGRQAIRQWQGKLGGSGAAPRARPAGRCAEEGR